MIGRAKYLGADSNSRGDCLRRQSAACTLTACHPGNAVWKGVVTARRCRCRVHGAINIDGQIVDGCAVIAGPFGVGAREYVLSRLAHNRGYPDPRPKEALPFRCDRAGAATSGRELYRVAVSERIVESRLNGSLIVSRPIALSVIRRRGHQQYLVYTRANRRSR